MRRYRQAQATAARYEAAAAGERQIAAALLSLTGAGWILLVDRRWPGSAVANVDMILIGPGGVFVIDVKNWRDPPNVVDGRLHAGADDRHDNIDKLLAITGKVQDSLAALQIAPAAVEPVMVFAGRSMDVRVRSVRLLGATEAAPSLAGSPRRLTGPQVHHVVRHLEQAFPAYDVPTIEEASAPAVDTAAGEDVALFDAQAVVRAHEQAIYARPIESWMTFLHPDQLALVRRRWNGPARISGPAGTGKTVVGLHRAVWLAQHTTGRILYITFVRNLPRVQAHLLSRLSPAVADRVEFCSLHSWALALLNQRGVAQRLDTDRINTCFSLAWYHAGKGSVLQQLEPNPAYWQDEIAYVIKGRGIADLVEYLRTTRPGRRTALQRAHKEAVWRLYQEYERIRNERGVHDFADVLLTALSEVHQRPVVPGYAAVIADEVQDLTLTGVRLLHALVGDAPNGLLLIGDGQQAVYPGGFRLADAGIDIRGGRAEVLKVNYRNAADILTAATTILDGQTFDDIDGSVVTTPAPVETSYHNGTVVRTAAATFDEHDDALITAIRELISEVTASDSRLGDTAVLCARTRDVAHYHRLLLRAGLPVCKLVDYDGQPIDAVKVGTFRRAKGSEFKYVFLPRYDEAVHDAQRGGFADPDRIALAKRQLFVGMTRARDMLWLGTIATDEQPRRAAHQ